MAWSIIIPATAGVIVRPFRLPEAVWALAKLSPDRAARLLPPLLEAKDVGLRCAAIGASPW